MDVTLESTFLLQSLATVLTSICMYFVVVTNKRRPAAALVSSFLAFCTSAATVFFVAELPALSFLTAAAAHSASAIAFVLSGLCLHMSAAYVFDIPL